MSPECERLPREFQCAVGTGSVFHIISYYGMEIWINGTPHFVAEPILLSPHDDLFTRGEGLPQGVRDKDGWHMNHEQLVSIAVSMRQQADTT